jgi:hypothetical protein
MDASGLSYLWTPPCRWEGVQDTLSWQHRIDSIFN